MSIFLANFTKQYTNTCQTLIVTDTSNYGFNDNDQHVTKEDATIRRVFLRDLSGNILQTKDIGVDDTVTFDLTLISINFLYLEIGLVVAGLGFGYSASGGGFLPCVL